MPSWVATVRDWADAFDRLTAQPDRAAGSPAG
jgi:hypothetical protein